MMDPLLRVFIGYDSRESVAYHVLASSILRRATLPIAIVPLTLQSVSRIYKRERGPTEATEFSMTRFLVPYLSDYRGVSLFLDCDMICRVDLLDLWLELLMQPGKAVWCCQHDYVPKALTKFDGHEQTKYPRKNWSSFLAFDNAKCESLTPEYVNRATGLELHRMHWAQDDQIGSLPLTWNHLVGEYPFDPAAKMFHMTNGGPWHGKEFDEGPEAEIWRAELGAMLDPFTVTAAVGVTR